MEAAQKLELIYPSFRYRGVFDFIAIWKACIKWFKERGMKVYNPKYADKTSVLDYSEMEIVLYGEVKMTEYVKWKAKITLKTWDSKFIEVNAKRMLQGRFEMKVESSLEFDYQKAYTDAPILKKIGYLVSQMKQKDAWEVAKKSCKLELLKLNDEIKKICEAETVKYG